MRIKTLAIIGVGLIGGSIGLAARKRNLADRIVGAGRQQATLDRALALGAIDEGTLEIATAMRDADLAVFCTPVDRIATQVLTAAESCKPGAILLDAGSTKSQIVRQVEEAGLTRASFVGCHPLAGSEKRGPEHSDSELFQDRLTIVTPTPQTNSSAVHRVSSFWQALGSRVAVMSPEEHDRALAVTSHLPHLVAAALAGILPDELHSFTATGFRDTTRIASGDPELWAAILAQNRDALRQPVERLAGRLLDFSKALENSDWQHVFELLSQAKRVRDALGN